MRFFLSVYCKAKLLHDSYEIAVLQRKPKSRSYMNSKGTVILWFSIRRRAKDRCEPYKRLAFMLCAITSAILHALKLRLISGAALLAKVRVLFLVRPKRV